MLLFLTRRLLLSDGRAARSLASPSIGMRSLSANRQRTAMPQSSVTTNVHQALDVHLDSLAEIALNLALRLKDGADSTEFVLTKILDPCIKIDMGLVKNRRRPRAPDTVNVS